MRLHSAPMYTGTLLAFVVLMSWTIGFSVGVGADTAADAQVSPGTFTITKAEFGGEESDTAGCELSTLPAGWCEELEGWDPFGLDGTAFDRWLEAAIMEFAYTMTNTMLGLSEWLVNGIAPAAYTMKTTFGVQLTTIVGQVGSYGGLLGITAYHLWRVKSVFSEVAA